MKIKYRYSLVSNYLQLTALYSQLGDHKYAMKLGKKCLKYFKHLSLLIVAISKNTLTHKWMSRHKFWNEFEKFVNKVLQMVELIIDQLDINCFVGDHFFHSFHHITFSDMHPQLTTTWVKNTTIAYFMHIQYASLHKIKQEIKLKEIFSEAFFSLFVLLSSCILFMVATENRLICMEKCQEESFRNKFKIKSIFEESHFQ